MVKTTRAVVDPDLQIRGEGGGGRGGDPDPEIKRGERS